MTSRAPTPEEKSLLRGLFQQPEAACLDCGGYHLRACPRIKRQICLGNGNRVEVEYWQHGQYDDSETIYPEEIFDEEPE
jgi:hypothetical protein